MQLVVSLMTVFRLGLYAEQLRPSSVMLCAFARFRGKGLATLDIGGTNFVLRSTGKQNGLM